MDADLNDTTEGAPAQPGPLPCHPPFVWPEPRWLAGQARYETQPPFDPILSEADLIAAVLVGAADGTIAWLQRLLVPGQARRVLLVVVVYPAGPTREEHLLALEMLQAEVADAQRKLDVRVWPVQRWIEPDAEKMTLPPTVLLAHDSRTARSWLCIGSVGDAGRDPLRPTSFNLVFQPDDALRDQWRRWFQYVFSVAAPLTPQTVRIPALVPPRGDPTAAALWAQFECDCRLADMNTTRPTVDSETGEVTAEATGEPVKPWDGGATQLDPLAQVFQRVYAAGSLVTVDETTRLKPLEIPVKATLLGEQGERVVGTVKQKQSFSLLVLDETVAKQVNKCRHIDDLMALLTYMLSKGNRWIPEPAKVLLEAELTARNQKGLDGLNAAMGGEGVAAYVQGRATRLRQDLDKMYRDLHRGDTVPAVKVQEVLDTVQTRLAAALGGRIAPRVNYNRLAPPDLTLRAAVESWAQPFSLLIQSARLLRTSRADPFFPRNFVGLSFGQPEFERAMNIFDDAILKSGSLQQAKADLARLDQIEADNVPLKEKCVAVWRIVSGVAPP